MTVLGNATSPRPGKWRGPSTAGGRRSGSRRGALIQTLAGHLAVALIALNTDRTPAPLPRRVQGGTGPGERVHDQATGRARVADQRFEYPDGLLRGVQRAAVHGTHLQHGAHQARPAVLGQVGAVPDLSHVRGACLPAYRA